MESGLLLGKTREDLCSGSIILGLSMKSSAQDSKRKRETPLACCVRALRKIKGYVCPKSDHEVRVIGTPSHPPQSEPQHTNSADRFASDEGRKASRQ